MSEPCKFLYRVRTPVQYNESTSMYIIEDELSYNSVHSTFLYLLVLLVTVNLDFALHIMYCAKSTVMCTHAIAAIKLAKAKPCPL
jgi:hypothetical protein